MFLKLKHRENKYKNWRISIQWSHGDFTYLEWLNALLSPYVCYTYCSESFSPHSCRSSCSSSVWVFSLLCFHLLPSSSHTSSTGLKPGDSSVNPPSGSFLLKFLGSLSCCRPNHWPACLSSSATYISPPLLWLQGEGVVAQFVLAALHRQRFSKPSPVGAVRFNFKASFTSIPAGRLHIFMLKKKKKKWFWQEFSVPGDLNHLCLEHLGLLTGLDLPRLQYKQDKLRCCPT